MLEGAAAVAVAADDAAAAEGRELMGAENVDASVGVDTAVAMPVDGRGPNGDAASPFVDAKIEVGGGWWLVDRCT